MCFAVLKFVDFDTGVITTLRSHDGDFNISGNNITVTMTANRHYGVIISAVNAAGTAIHFREIGWLISLVSYNFLWILLYP